MSIEKEFPFEKIHGERWFTLCDEPASIAESTRCDVSLACDYFRLYMLLEIIPHLTTGLYPLYLAVSQGNLGVGPLQRFAQMTRLLPEYENEYVRYHEQVWPKVLETIAECRITNYSIFLSNGFLFSYFEYHGSDYEADMRKMAACPETQRWWLITNPMQEPMADVEVGRKWSQMKEVFHFDPTGRTDPLLDTVKNGN